MREALDLQLSLVSWGMRYHGNCTKNEYSWVLFSRLVVMWVKLLAHLYFRVVIYNMGFLVLVYQSGLPRR